MLLLPIAEPKVSLKLQDNNTEPWEKQGGEGMFERVARRGKAANVSGAVGGCVGEAAGRGKVLGWRLFFFFSNTATGGPQSLVEGGTSWLVSGWRRTRQELRR